MPKQITLTNILANSGKGYLSGSNSNNTKYTSTSNLVGDGSTICCKIVPAATGEATITTSKKYTLDNTHKYYISFWIKFASTTTGSFDFYWPVAEPLAFHTPSITASANQWVRCSTVFDRTSFTSGSYQCRFDWNNEPGKVTAYQSSLMLFDLTATFGAGQEPSKERMDQYITSFGDSLTITYYTIEEEKAMAYEEIVTKNSSGNIVNGSSSIGSNGYIEGTWLKTTAASSKAGNFATVDSSGWIYYRTPAETKNDIGASSVQIVTWSAS